MVQQAENRGAFEAMLSSERMRLVRLCASLSGNVDAAEDLAQETLIEAWQHREKVYALQGLAQWLSMIAQNVCRRWIRSHSREMTRLVSFNGGGEDVQITSNLEFSLVDEGDLAFELERHELACLLDRAMALLPPETRTLLVERYINELPQAEVAARLGLNERLVAVRLHRGKLALRRILSNELSQELSSYGVHGGDTPAWQETRIWCAECGRHRLKGRFFPSEREFVLRCPYCDADPESYTIDHVVYGQDDAGLLTGTSGYKRALSRLMIWANRYYRDGLLNRSVVCMKCGRVAPVQMGLPDDVPLSSRGRTGFQVTCACQPINFTTLSALALATPEGQHFWRQHPRIQTLPEREMETDGQAALVIRFESLTETTWLDVILNQETFEVRKIVRSSC
jgi:RNA polymerase sigma factor (sigma-70 family)